MCLRTVVFCLLVIVIVDYICYTEALDENGKGVCVVKHSSRQRRKKSYNAVINKWCGHRKCVVRKYKYETYLTWTNHTICCTGWQYNNELDICSPICSIDCHGGLCIAPDQCQCQAPAYLDKTNTCITPTCNPTCVNAICHQNNTCICNENFSRYNATHCFQCDAGYTADENLNCVPVCESTCINSTCTAPNTCTCNPGYQFKSGSVCSPKCDCVNAECVAPNTCSCHKGYMHLNETKCVPKCTSCNNGDCVSPDTCSCHRGYERVNSTCAPKCENCSNGSCIAPNIRSCYKGYIRVNGTCTPKCDSCSNGDCIAPNNCTCHSGYLEVGGQCRLVCSVPCVNGFCSAPDVCSCNDGFVKNVNGNGCVKPKSCDGNCEGYCLDGECIPRDCRMPIDLS